MSYKGNYEGGRKARHECLFCGKPLGNWQHVRCPDCMAAYRELNLGRYYMLQMNHQCTRCTAKMPDNYYYTVCEKCRAKSKQKWEEKKRERMERAI